MADGSGTPTTNYGLVTLNTAVDPPSGKAINELAEDVDAALKTVEDKIDGKPGMGLIIALGG